MTAALTGEGDEPEGAADLPEPAGSRGSQCERNHHRGARNSQEKQHPGAPSGFCREYRCPMLFLLIGWIRSG